MNFNAYYINIEYDGWTGDYMYLESFLYFDPFEKSETTWSKGNGHNLGYNTENEIYWDESIIFNL